jgi:alanine-alpha-ketoisovalerate/valine-pyruvate aminotransferase
VATPVRAGLAVATPGVVQAGGRTLGVVRLAITEMGRATVGAMMGQRQGEALEVSARIDRPPRSR